MEIKREVVCGADIHKQFLLATILSNSGQKVQDRFEMNFEGLLSFRKWLLDHSCQKLAVESTANYWQPTYLVVGKDVEFVLANAYQIEDILDSIPSKKIKAKREEIRNAIQVHILQVQMDLIGRLLGRLSLMRFRFSSERFMWSKKDPNRKEDRQIPTSSLSECFNGKEECKNNSSFIIIANLFGPFSAMGTSP